MFGSSLCEIKLNASRYRSVHRMRQASSFGEVVEAGLEMHRAKLSSSETKSGFRQSCSEGARVSVPFLVHFLFTITSMMFK